jgi:DNA polymerase III epsilon subunit-like protein
MQRATWFCVDIECSGPVPGLYDMISLGCVPVTRSPGDSPRHRVGEERFYVEILPTAPRVDAGAMAVNGLDLDELRAHGTPLREALEQLTAFVHTRCVDGSEAVFVGHNAPFDWSFVAYSYHSEGLANPFGYKALDTKALSMGVLDLHWLDSNKERLAELLPLPEVETDKVHRADYDAWYQAHVLAQLLDRMGSRREVLW